MSKQRLFRDFVNERIAAAAMEIFGQYEKTLAVCQEEICRSKEQIALLQGMLFIQPEIKLHRTDVQQLRVPEPPQIKEEHELWTSHGKEQLQGLQSDTKDSIFTSPRVKTHCDPEDLSLLPPVDQTPTMENRQRDSLPTNTTEKQIKAEPDEEDYGAPGPASHLQPPFVTPDFPTAPNLEEEERGGLLPELTDRHLGPLPTRVLKSPTKSRKRKDGSIPSPCSSPGPSLRTSPSPSPWTRPILSSCSSTEDEDVSSGKAESRKVEKPYRCDDCGKTFSESYTLVRHRRVHTGEKPYKCEECGKAFTEKHSVVRHNRIHTGERPYQCEDCDQSFIDNTMLLAHRKVHTGVYSTQYTCLECDKAFSIKANFDRHRRSHTGEKPYYCSECDKPFSRKSHLERHKICHTGEKPYQCDDCEKVFARKSHLMNHQKTHTGEKLYHCEECDKAYIQKNSLIIHRMVHTGERPYQCKECAKVFSSKGSLVNHKKIHTGEKPYQCKDCGKAFREKCTLVSHRRLHTSEKPYLCVECDKTFVSKKRFTSHKRIHTGKKALM